MKRLVFTLISMVLGVSPVYADTCSKNLMPTFTAAQANLICTKGLRQVEPTANFETVAAAGTVQGDAAALSGTKFFHRVTGANGTVGVILPAAAAADVGEVHTILNTTAGVLKVYPASGGTINGAAADAAFSALTGIKPIVCYTTAASTWICS
jgi:hypothetical protein